ncbi:Gfo/Idh/MocA family oxidoreductase [Sphingomonas sp. dw_22]|uniref:Gfo/Idh/MocA family protein n=1 Tax=Sphingomonas sp. dw_22 TaxID=2721175 RepID=UPI001BD21119|nr:Gfo/Idh/MocA family oxidoreductase [Sphingomonas sp. dw_22]
MNETTPLNVAVVGLGKMGVSHFAIANALDTINVTAVCDRSTLLGQMVEKYSKVRYIPDYDKLIETPGLDAVIIATPTRLHDSMVRQALERGIHVFCEKPMTLSSELSDTLTGLARDKGLVGQVGYHNRFVGTFGEARRLIAAGAIGRIRHVHAEAYGPVVLKPVAKTWRSNAAEGGGCLYDYAAHPINLMNWYVGRPVECIGADLTRQYSSDVEDAVYADLRFANGVTGQVSVNWSDDSIRKMTTKITIWGDGGKISVDRQELQVFANGKGTIPEGYNQGWTVRYITDLTPTVSYYLRGEEYSAQIEGFAKACNARQVDCVNSFASAAETDYTLELIRARSLAEPPAPAALGQPNEVPRQRGVLAKVFGR